jgi:Fimbrial assembly protein (PilN)
MSDRRATDERRSGAERRSLRDRQRGATELVTVVEIAGSELRVALLKRLAAEDRPDHVEALSLTWRKEASHLNTEEGLIELSVALRDLVDGRNLQTSSFHFVLGGELCITKAVHGAVDAVRNELRQIEDRSRLYLSLGPGEKVMVASMRPIDARHQYAVGSVCNRETLNTVNMAAQRAGIQIDTIEPALIAESRVVGRLKAAPTEPCLLMYVDDNSVEVGVCHHGRILLDYRPGGRTDPSEIGPVVHTHLNRLQRHAGRQLNIVPPKLNRVYLCGGRQAIAKALASFAAYKNLDVREIHPDLIQATWKLDDKVEGSAIVPALGTLLHTYQSADEYDAPNFMSHIIASAREPIRPILVRSLLPLAAVLLVGFVGLLFNFRVQKEVNTLTGLLDALQVVQSRSLELRLKESAAREKIAELTRLVAGVQPAPVKDIIARIGHCMPSDVWLNDLVVEDLQRVKLTGNSFLEAGVFDFVRWLGQAPGFEDVALPGTRPSVSSSGPTIEFNVELNLGDLDGPVKEVARNE